MCLISNLILPGLGLVAAGRIVSGTIQFILALVAFILALFAVIGPMIHDINNLLNDRNDKLEKPDLNMFIIMALIAIAVWVWSTIEIFIYYKPQKESSKD